MAQAFWHMVPALASITLPPSHLIFAIGLCPQQILHWCPWSLCWPPSIRSRGVICNPLVSTTSSFGFIGSLALNLFLHLSLLLQNYLEDQELQVLSCATLVWKLDMWPALLYFCWCCTTMTHKETAGMESEVVISLLLDSPHSTDRIMNLFP